MQFNLVASFTDIYIFLRYTLASGPSISSDVTHHNQLYHRTSSIGSRIGGGGDLGKNGIIKKFSFVFSGIITYFPRISHRCMHVKAIALFLDFLLDLLIIN